MPHEENIHMVCRMCLDKLSGTQYIISETSWLCDFLHNYCFKDSFNKRDITKGSKNLCESCYKNVLYTKKCKDKFVDNQKKLPTSRRKDFKMKQPIYVVEDEAWDHSDNCKVCAHDVELHDQESPERPSPGVVKRKATDSFLTPQG